MVDFVVFVAAAAAAAVDMQPKQPNGRSCYGCIGWCTYGDLCKPPANVKWHDVATELGVQGQGWPAAEMANPYNRFPAKAKAIVPPAVWAKSQLSAGLKTRFQTAATDLWVHWNITTGGLPFGDWLWPLDGHVGVDIYIEDDATPTGQRQLRWATSSGNAPMMSLQKANATTAGFTTGLFNIPPRADGLPRNFTVYLPLATTPASFSIAAMDAHSVANVPLAAAPAPRQRVLFYGTSIMNGAAANRPGMGWPQQCERMLGMDGINIGFGSNGKEQPCYPQTGLLSEIDYDVAVVDPEYNMVAMDPVTVFNLTFAFLGDLKRRKPAVPVLFMEGHPNGRGWIDADARSTQNATQEAFRRAYNALLATGVEGLYYGRGERKFGGRDMATDFEAQASTVSGVHPPPLALRSIASHVSGVVKAIMNGSATAAPVPTGGTWPPRAPSSPRTARPAAEDYKWVDAATLGVEGKGFAAEANDASFWQRFPSSAQGSVPRGIFKLAMQPSGMLVRFRTNADAVQINITRPDLQPNTDDIFPSNGKYGIDVHVQDSSPANFGRWRWAATEAGTSVLENGTLTLLLKGEDRWAPGGLHNITVYLPTYAAVGTLHVGVAPATAALLPLRLYPGSPGDSAHAASAGSLSSAGNEAAAGSGADAGHGSSTAAASVPHATGPVMVWGSSIAQGGVVTNAGMTWPSNLQRILNLPLLNFGFSGSCQMQLSVAATLMQVKPKPRMFVMDCLPNMQQDTAAAVNAATVAVVTYLRAQLGPAVPIVVIEGHRYTNDWIKKSQESQELSLAAAQQAAVAKLSGDGMLGLHYIRGEGKLGPDAAAASESTGGMGVHPTSLAHLHIAEFLAEKLRPILQQANIN